MCFSPVAGILFVERCPQIGTDTVNQRFSPVAGILFVESSTTFNYSARGMRGFSPVAGILFVES